MAGLVPLGRLGVGRDDDLGRGRRALGGADLAQTSTDELGCQRHVADRRAAVGDARLAQQLGRRSHRRVGRRLRAADAAELHVGLVAAPVLERLVVDAEVHARGPQPLGERDRELPRHARTPDPDALDRTGRDLEQDPLRGPAGGDELVSPERLGRELLDVRRGGRHAIGLERSTAAMTALRTLTLSNGLTSVFIEIQRVWPAGMNATWSFSRDSASLSTSDGGVPVSQHIDADPFRVRRAATARSVLPSFRPHSRPM